MQEVEHVQFPGIVQVLDRDSVKCPTPAKVRIYPVAYDDKMQLGPDPGEDHENADARLLRVCRNSCLSESAV